jgi:TldD protein
LLEEYQDLADFFVREATKAGADYAEARIHGGWGCGFLLKNGKPEPSIIEDSFGIGARVISKGAMAFGATNTLTRKGARGLAETTLRMARSSRSLVKDPVGMDDSKPSRRRISVPEKEPVEGADPNWLKALLVEVDKRVDSDDEVKIANRILVASAGVEEKYYVNSDGARTTSRVPRFNFFGILTAMLGGETAQRMIQQGETGGLEVVRRIGLLDLVETEARTLRRVLRTARKPPTGVMDVVLGPELSGIAAHESVGHPQEADRILGREGAQAGESYLDKDSLGFRVGSPQASVSDDPTIAHSNGYCPVDDEGVEARKRRLIVDGRVTEFLLNRSTSEQIGAKNNGASRSAGFDREPIIRMSNTFVEPGDYTTEELLKEVDDGIYLKSFTEWNIDDKRMNQRYVGLEAYRVLRGEVKEMVKAPVLEITTPALWGAVRGRSRTLEFEAASCGKGDPMQGIPVWTGGPDTLLSHVRVVTR